MTSHDEWCHAEFEARREREAIGEDDASDEDAEGSEPKLTKRELALEAADRWHDERHERSRGDE